LIDTSKGKEKAKNKYRTLVVKTVEEIHTVTRERELILRQILPIKIVRMGGEWKCLSSGGRC
jgi:hypothetical protein